MVLLCSSRISRCRGQFSWWVCNCKINYPPILFFWHILILWSMLSSWVFNKLFSRVPLFCFLNFHKMHPAVPFSTIRVAFIELIPKTVSWLPLRPTKCWKGWEGLRTVLSLNPNGGKIFTHQKRRRKVCMLAFLISIPVLVIVQSLWIIITLSHKWARCKAGYSRCRFFCTYSSFFVKEFGLLVWKIFFFFFSIDYFGGIFLPSF